MHARITIISSILGVRSYATQQSSRLDEYLLIPSWGNLSVEDRLLQRKEIVLSSCAKSQESQQPLTEREKQELYKSLVVDDRNRILYCPVPKACSTSWRNILLVSSGKFRTVEELGSPVRKSFERRLNTYNKAEREYRLKNYVRFMVSREPLSRIVSNFKDKFSNPTLNSWRRQLCADIVKLVTTLGREHNRSHLNISIDEFAEYVISLGWNVSVGVQTNMNVHWRPMSLLCRPCHVSYDYYSSAETVREDGEYLFKKFGFPQSIHFPWSHESPKAATGSPSDVVKWYLSQLSDRQLNQLVSIYEADYEMFGYDLPGKH